MQRKDNFDVLEKTVNEICHQNKVALYDFEIKSTKKGEIMLVFITKIGGTSIDDCVNVSRMLSDKLDETDYFQGKYYLEVSSPGLERSLMQKKHYVSAINEQISVTYKTEEKTSTVYGTLKEVLPDHIKVSGVNGETQILLKDIKKAKTVFNFTNKENK